ncbi:hypothetical protein LTR49_027439 [Elasticomyces elasticus]|nr:hypothetical protein LTR49_027439 [Elasticomyces elasticus]
MDATTTYAPLARFFAATLPALYVGATWCQSIIAVKLILDHAPNARTIAKEWLQGYQWGPAWVIPTIIPGAAANIYLAYLTRNDPFQCALYATSATLVLFIMPFTLGWMEPGVNGACKWKIQSLLKDEGYYMPPWNGISSAHRHSASEQSKKWSEEWTMKELVAHWKKFNDFR